ncbi:MAG: hypothetical protein ACKVIH_13445 [Burkholderiales bacterium]
MNELDEYEKELEACKLKMAAIAIRVQYPQANITADNPRAFGPRCEQISGTNLNFVLSPIYLSKKCFCMDNSVTPCKQDRAVHHKVSLALYLLVPHSGVDWVLGCS